MHERLRESCDEITTPLAPGAVLATGMFAAPVELTVDIGYLSETNFFVGFDDDVRQGGLLVATLELLSVGTPIDLSFVLPEGVPVRASGHVAWHREIFDADGDRRPAMGIAFDALDDHAVRAIERYIAVRAPIFHD